MRGAFVIQISKASPGGRLEGSVEEVDTGKQARFLFEHNLIGFLRERFASSTKNRTTEETTDEREDDRL